MTPGQMTLADAVTLTDDERDVLHALRTVGPCHDIALAAYMLGHPERYRRQAASGPRSRRAALVAKGLVRWTGQRVTLEGGGKAKVWAA